MLCEDALTHEEDAVNTHAPLLCKHGFRFGPKRAWRLSGLALLLRLDELLGLREEHSEEANGNREAGADPEDSLPRLSLITDAQVGASC